MAPRLLVLDDYEGRIAGAPATARLRKLAEVTVLDRPLGDGDNGALAAVRVLLAIRERTRLDAALLARLPDLELVLQTGGHAYHVDQEAATGRGIVVALSRRAQMASASVPELTFGLMLALLRRIHPLAGELAAGEWPAAMGGTLAGRTLGILGLGRHGRPVARIAAAFGMVVLAWDRDPGREYPDDEPVAERLPLDDLLARSDVVSVHLKL
jgi:phosphoglycerate dehydrogenase-like enzyme